MSETRYAKVRCAIVKVEGRRYEIPEIWLAGRSRVHEREGAGPLDAYHLAIMDWHEQELLGEQYAREQAEGK